VKATMLVSALAIPANTRLSLSQSLSAHLKIDSV